MAAKFDISSSVLLALIFGMTFSCAGGASEDISRQVMVPVNHGKTAAQDFVNWTACLGTQQEYFVTVAGTYDRYVVVSNVRNQVYIVDLVNGSLLKNVTMSHDLADTASFTVLPNGVLVQTNYASIIAWSLPDLTQLWSVDTYRIYEAGITPSTTNRFFCLWVYLPRQIVLGAPVCYSISDGSTVWSGVANQSLFSSSGDELLEYGGVLIVEKRTEVIAIEVETGVKLWSLNVTSAWLLVADRGLVIFQNIYQNGTWAVDVKTGQTVWNHTAEYLAPPVLTSNGLILTQAGANYISNGSSAWSFETVCDQGLYVTTPTQPGQAQFLCSISYSAGYNYTVGDVLTGSSSKPMAVVTSAGNTFFGSSTGFYFFATIPAQQSFDQYCIEPLNEP